MSGPSHPGPSTSTTSNVYDNFTPTAMSLNMPDACGSCEDGAKPIARCMDCNDLLCDLCFQAHRRLRLTKDHRIFNFSNETIASPTIDSAICSSPERRTSPCTGISTICDTHQEVNKTFCSTCFIAVCTECVISDHALHELSYLNDDNPTAIRTVLLENARRMTREILDALDATKVISGRVEIKIEKMNRDVESVFKRYINAFENRSQALAAQIEDIHRSKIRRLTSQMERLQIAYARIVRTSDMLKKANAQVDSEFIVVNEKAESELKAIRMTRLELLPCEDDFLHFSVADNGLFNAISSLGDITSRINFQYTTETFNRSDEQLSILSAPLLRMDGTNLNCRPVYGVDLRIIVKYPYDNVPQSFGRDGTDDGLLNRPWGVCCNSSGHIIVSDRSNNRIQVFDSNGRFLYKFGKCGSGPAQFKTPAGITVNPFNQIVVADKDNHRIQILSMLGDPILLFGTEGHANGQFHYPWDVACNAQGDIVVSDTRNHRIQLFNCEGAFIGKFGCDNDWRPPYAKAHKLLDSPRGVCFTPQGNVLVTDFNNHRIVTIDKTLSHAQFLGEEGTGPKQFCRPQGIICDDHGNIIVVDTKNYRLQIFDKHGNFLFEFGKRGRNADQFESPCGMCLTPEGRIIVVDYGHTRVQIF